MAHHENAYDARAGESGQVPAGKVATTVLHVGGLGWASEKAVVEQVLGRRRPVREPGLLVAGHELAAEDADRGDGALAGLGAESDIRGGSGPRSSPRPRSSPGDLVYFDGSGTSPCTWVAATHRRPADRNGRAEYPDEWLVRVHPGRCRPPVERRACTTQRAGQPQLMAGPVFVRLNEFPIGICRTRLVTSAAGCRPLWCTRRRARGCMSATRGTCSRTAAAGGPQAS